MIRIKDEKTKVRGGVAVLEKTRTPSALPKAAAGGGKAPTGKPPISAAAAGRQPAPRGGSGLAPPFLTQVDFDTLVWLEERRVALGLRSRAEVIRAVLASARTGK